MMYFESGARFHEMSCIVALLMILDYVLDVWAPGTNGYIFLIIFLLGGRWRQTELVALFSVFDEVIIVLGGVMSLAINHGPELWRTFVCLSFCLPSNMCGMQVSFAVDGILLLASLSIAKALLEVW
ncbi:hypothetical protein SAY86_008282 [Trapa natans]|uniref:Uncharacterized protein n=1 Tax=Trapa natans TaxID=22666 RepID=A0AAN7QAV5_TRANT|nr:hypothetical protein SAY86_008282 [Trapa natans]